jgi:ribosome-binding protein aMBF1 (putative translation factor)
MASRDDGSAQIACCEICGAPLGDEVVVQEFADGSLVHLCTECAAGADVGEPAGNSASRDEIAWPDAPPLSDERPAAESDPLEKTRELLLPVVDLISLQREMQAALERLAASLERFAAEMITDAQDKSAVESRLQMLERELDATRRQLSEAETILNTVDAAPDNSADLAASPLASPVTPEVGSMPSLVAPPEATQPLVPGIPAPLVAPAAEASSAPASTPENIASFRIEEVQATQRYFNESPFINRIRDVRRSLGRPKANVSRFPNSEPLALVTVAWDIVWYQYLVDLRRDLSTSAERVSLFREGMDLDELPYQLREKNSVINDDGRLDASELEVKLLSDPSALITELSPEEARLMEDATEEVWDHKISPEFKWDD